MMSQLLSDLDAQMNSIPSPTVGLKFIFKGNTCKVEKRLVKSFEYSTETSSIGGDNVITYGYWNAWFGKKIKLVN